jgi:hypothetical protein
MLLAARLQFLSFSQDAAEKWDKLLA